MLGMTAYAAIRAMPGNLPDVESADLTITPAPGYEGEISQAAMIFLLARAFSSGCAALTGVEAISNGVPAFRSRRARTPRRHCSCWAPSRSR